MESWELEFHWLRVRHFVRDSLGHGSLPDLQTVLMIIGVQEYGRPGRRFERHEKQDLMHVGVCEVLAPLGYYHFTHRDEDGWPHYETLRPVDVLGHEAQEQLLKRAAIAYFDRHAATEALRNVNVQQPSTTEEGS